MGCASDIKEKENKPKNQNINSNVNNSQKVDNNEAQNQNQNQNDNVNNVNKNDNIGQNNANTQMQNKPENQINQGNQVEQPNQNQNQNIKEINKEQEKRVENVEKPKKKAVEEKDLDTNDFNEDKYPIFQSNYFEKYIQNLRKITIMKGPDGVKKIEKLYITMDHNKKKAKVIKIEKEENGDNKKQHLNQKILNEDCTLQKFKADVEKGKDDFRIESKDIFSKSATTDIYIYAQNVDNYIIRIYLFYFKDTAELKMFQFQGNKFSYSTSNRSLTNLGPEEIVEKFNEFTSSFLEYRKQTFSLIDDQDYDENDFTQFQIEGLKMHNKYRTLHHSPDLKLNKELCEIAQKYADYLAEKRLFSHSHARFKGAAMGENLYMCSGFKPDGGAGVTSWYDEIKDYSFQNHCSTGGVVGHFTQVVWKGSQYVGMGIGQNGNSYYVVANYYPAGNWQGKDAENVLPK